MCKLEEWEDKNKELNTRVKENKSKFWKGFVKELKMRRMLVWNTIKKSLNNGDNSERPNEIMIVNGREARTEGEKASEFIKQYVSVNRVILNKNDRDKRKKIARRMTEYVRV